MTLGRAILLAMWGLFVVPLSVWGITFLLRAWEQLSTMSSATGFFPSGGIELIVILLAGNLIFLIGYLQVGKYDDRKKRSPRVLDDDDSRPMTR